MAMSPVSISYRVGVKIRTALGVFLRKVFEPPVGRAPRYW